MLQETYTVGGMHCQACARRIETALRPYGEQVEVDFPSATLRVVKPSVTLDQLNSRVTEAGAYTLSRPRPPLAIGIEPQPAVLTKPAGIARYYPLALIALYLAVGSFAGADGAVVWMRHFMAGFFLVFSFFKLLNIQAFAASYAMYDVVAGKVPRYGLVYPFIELALGLAYLFAWHMRPVLWATLAFSLIGGVGVVRSMTRKETIRCACLGAVLDVPVSTVTLIEDLGMAAMSALMLAI